MFTYLSLVSLLLISPLEYWNFALTFSEIARIHCIIKWHCRIESVYCHLCRFKPLELWKRWYVFHSQLETLSSILSTHYSPHRYHQNLFLHAFLLLFVLPTWRVSPLAVLPLRLGVFSVLYVTPLLLFITSHNYAARSQSAQLLVSSLCNCLEMTQLKSRWQQLRQQACY